MYGPGENITTDKSVILFRGCLKFRQYIPNKRHRYGIKVYKLCLLQGYTWHAKIYTGKEERERENLSHNQDKWSLSWVKEGLELTEQLLARKTYLTGTLRTNHKHNPGCVTTAKRRNEVEYNQAKGYIDLSDQLPSYGNTAPRGLMIQKIAIELFINMATVNSHRLYTLAVGKKLSIVQLKDTIVTSIFESVSVIREQATLSPRQTTRRKDVVKCAITNSLKEFVSNMP
ncbi:hypothetical protein PR048_010719 [Dryococelus australis]|uniref:PiggyBac transposable element-derived protein domain-containing protein n=1 Tax=Dryococelus australis TaxID=614101 RepID=A0ABQ9I4N7_9NEOP|nr:hypothetical protein PR048_010719 [Dryococelus australis]